MARDFARGFYRSSQWQRCRAAYIAERQAIDGGMCETCHKEPGVIVHHKTWLTPGNIDDPDITLSFDNLKLDCMTCHNKEHDGEDDENNRYVFGDDGQIIPIG